MNQIEDLITLIQVAADLAQSIHTIEGLQSQKLDNADKRIQIADEIRDAKYFFNQELTLIKEIMEKIEFFEL